jgi:hypothetical protein
MAGNFKQPRFSFFVTAGISLLLWVCPAASAQQPARRLAANGSARQWRSADCKGAPQTAQTPKTAPLKKVSQATSKKAKKKTRRETGSGRFRQSLTRCFTIARWLT